MNELKQQKMNTQSLDIFHSISFSGPIYMVQNAETKMSEQPTSLPKDGANFDEPMAHSCDRAA